MLAALYGCSGTWTLFRPSGGGQFWYRYRRRRGCCLGSHIPCRVVQHSVHLFPATNWRVYIPQYSWRWIVYFRFESLVNFRRTWAEAIWRPSGPRQLIANHDSPRDVSGYLLCTITSDINSVYIIHLILVIGSCNCTKSVRCSVQLKIQLNTRFFNYKIA